MSIVETRGPQIFPVLDPKQIETARRFASAEPKKFAPGEILYDVGALHPPCWLALKGSIELERRDGLGHHSHIIAVGPGQFTGEVGQLSGRAALAQAKAGPEGATAMPFDPPHLRALIIGSAEVGEIMMRAFILRRVALITEGDAGSVLVGRPGSPCLMRLEGFLGRNAYPYTLLDATNDPEGRAVVVKVSHRRVAHAAL